MTTSAREFSLAHLTMMEVAPTDLVRAAATAGYDGVGIRLVPTSDGVDHEMLSSRTRRAEVKRVLDDTGIRVVDVEVIRLYPHGFGDVRPFFDVAAAFGAGHVVCTVEDDDGSRRVDEFARLCAIAADYGVRPTLEYMVFSSVPTLTDALDLVTAAGGSAAVLVDALHHERGGGSPDDVRALTLSRAPYMQLCDSPETGRFTDRTVAREEAVYGRLLPGAGALPLAELLSQLDPETVVSVECPLIGQRSPADPVAVARAALAAARRVATA